MVYEFNEDEEEESDGYSKLDGIGVAMDEYNQKGGLFNYFGFV